MSTSEAPVVAFPPKMVESIILGLSNPLNRHLVKLVAFGFPEELRRHFRREVKNWLSEIQALRFKPDRRTGDAKFYFDLLFDYPLGGIEIRNMKSIMDLIAGEYDAHANKTPEETVAWLRDFHARPAERLHNGEDVIDMIPE